MVTVGFFFPLSVLYDELRCIFLRTKTVSERLKYCRTEECGMKTNKAEQAEQQATRVQEAVQFFVFVQWGEQKGSGEQGEQWKQVGEGTN